MDKHRRLRKERHDLYQCEVDILGGLRKTQSDKLRELNDIKTKMTLSKQSHRGPRTSKKAIKEIGLEDDLKRLQLEWEQLQSKIEDQASKCDRMLELCKLASA